MGKLIKSIEKHINKKLYTSVVQNANTGEITVLGKQDCAVDLFHVLKAESSFLMHLLVDICAADYPDRAERFEVIYQLLSTKLNHRLTVKLQLSELDASKGIPSLHQLYKGAVWLEREVFDMYGILFNNNPDMRRILTDYSFEGHPMRKDFPLSGNVETYYDEKECKIAQRSVNVSQEYRDFNFDGPWQGTKYLNEDDKNA